MAITAKRRVGACGNNWCSCSTGIHEGLTFGSGDLDQYGYWEKPCRICAVAHDAEMDAGRRDRLEQEYLLQYCEQDGMDLAEAQQHLRRYHQWLYEPAWPFTDEPEEEPRERQLPPR